MSALWLYAAEFKAKTHTVAPVVKVALFLGKTPVVEFEILFKIAMNTYLVKKGTRLLMNLLTPFTDWSKDKLRIELTLRTTELIDLNLYAW